MRWLASTGSCPSPQSIHQENPGAGDGGKRLELFRGHSISHCSLNSICAETFFIVRDIAERLAPWFLPSKCQQPPLWCPRYCDNEEQPSCTLAELLSHGHRREGKRRIPSPDLSPPKNHKLGHSHTSPSKPSASHYIDLWHSGSLSQTVDRCLHSQSQPTLQPFHPSSYLDTVLWLHGRVVKACEIVRILPSNSFPLLLFYQQQRLHDFVIAFQEICLMPLR